MKLKEAYLLQAARVPGNGGDVVTWLNEAKYDLSLEQASGVSVPILRVTPKGMHADKWFFVPVTNIASMVPAEPVAAVTGKLK